MYMVSVKPVDGPGPVLVSDDPEVVRAVVGAITRRYGADAPKARSAAAVAGTIGRGAEDDDTA